MIHSSVVVCVLLPTTILILIGHWPLASTNGIINCNFDSVFYSICLTYILWIVAVFLAVCVWCENNLLFVSVFMDIHLL